MSAEFPDYSQHSNAEASTSPGFLPDVSYDRYLELAKEQESKPVSMLADFDESIEFLEDYIEEMQAREDVGRQPKLSTDPESIAKDIKFITENWDSGI